MRSRSTSGASGTERVWIFRISTRPLRSGGWTAMRRSKRPGRSSAGSRTSGRFVAPRTITFVPGSKPSISVRIWLSVCSRSSWPPLIPPTLPDRERPIASSSSMKTIAGAASLACLNRSRTREAPTPTIASTNSEADMREEGGVRLARDRAGQQRLAGPGRPVEQHAARDPRAELRVALRVLEEVHDLDELVLGLVDPGDVVEGDSLLLAGLDPPRGRAAEAAEHAAASRPRLAAEHPDEEPHQQDRRQEAEQERGPQRPALVGRLGVDDDVLVRSSSLVSCGGIDEVGDLGLEPRDRHRLGVAGRVVGRLALQLALDRVLLRADLLDVAGLHLVDEERLVGHPLALRGRR